MNRMFGSLAMIDVLSICVLTLLTLSLPTQDAESAISAERDQFASNVMTIKAELTWPKDKLPLHNSPLLGMEIVLQGTPYNGTHLDHGILRIENRGSRALIIMRPPTTATSEHYLHLYIRDRGELSLSEIGISVDVKNHPRLKSPMLLTIPKATRLSWKIPLHVPDGAQELSIVAFDEITR